MLPTCRTTTRLETFSLMEGLSANLTAPSWRTGEWLLFLLTILFAFFFGPVTCDAGHPAFFGAAAMTPLADRLVCVSAFVPHPFRGNEPVQMFWKEERQPGGGGR